MLGCDGPEMIIFKSFKEDLSPKSVKTLGMLEEQRLGKPSVLHSWTQLLAAGSQPSTRPEPADTRLSKYKLSMLSLSMAKYDTDGLLLTTRESLENLKMPWVALMLSRVESTMSVIGKEIILMRSGVFVEEPSFRVEV